MTDQKSVENLAFNFASRTLVYRRHAQGLSSSVPAFSSFVRRYLDQVLKADQCAHYDIVIAANTATAITRQNWATLKCLSKTGLKLTTELLHSGVRHFEMLDKAISPDEVSP